MNEQRAKGKEQGAWRREKKEMMLRIEEILRMEMSVSHWNGFFEWNDLK